MNIGGRYNWKGQPEQLVYLGYNWSGNGYWHQLAKVEEPDVIWCEIPTSDLHMLEETVMQQQAHEAVVVVGGRNPIAFWADDMVKTVRLREIAKLLDEPPTWTAPIIQQQDPWRGQGKRRARRA